MSHVTFKRIADDQANIYDDTGDLVGQVFRFPDILRPGEMIFSVHLSEDPRGPKHVADRSRIGEVAEERLATHRYLKRAAAAPSRIGAPTFRFANVFALPPSCFAVAASPECPTSPDRVLGKDAPRLLGKLPPESGITPSPEAAQSPRRLPFGSVPEPHPLSFGTLDQVYSTAYAGSAVTPHASLMPGRRDPPSTAPGFPSTCLRLRWNTTKSCR